MDPINLLCTAQSITYDRVRKGALRQSINKQNTFMIYLLIKTFYLYFNRI
jgi:hypothetical protein